uniref:Uncharacterized protein n=1 Tax=Moniliophthora roreri TaxID=221103 RepID=A0A0W0GA12_MONRR
MFWENIDRNQLGVSSVTCIISQVKPGEPVILCKKSNHALVDVVCEWPALPAHALKSDYEPSSAEVLHAKAALQAEEVALGRYDAEIKRLRQAAEELQEKSVALKERMSQRRAMVSHAKGRHRDMGYSHNTEDDDPGTTRARVVSM